MNISHCISQKFCNYMVRLSISTSPFYIIVFLKLKTGIFSYDNLRYNNS